MGKATRLSLMMVERLARRFGIIRPAIEGMLSQNPAALLGLARASDMGVGEVDALKSRVAKLEQTIQDLQSRIG